MESLNTWTSRLSDNHRRRISTILSHLDEVLCRFEAWAKDEEVASVMYSERNTLAPKQKEQILEEVFTVREMLTKLRDSLGLEPKVDDVSVLIWSHCSSLWADILELSSKRLRHYGELPEHFPEYMEPKVEALVERLDRISEVIKL